MYYCINCQSKIEKLASYEEPRPYGETVAYEKFYVCPNCGGDDVIQLKYCDKCGHPITGDYIETTDSELICENCFNKRSIFDI